MQLYQQDHRIGDVMMKTELDKTIQIGLVVPDRDAAVDNYVKYFGMPKEAFTTMDTRDIQWSDTKFDGEPVAFNLKIAIINWKGIQFELIEPLEKDVQSEYTRFLAETKGVGGLHHLSVTYTDYEGMIEDYLGQKVHVCNEGNMHGAYFRYFDLRKETGLVLEVLDFPQEYVDGVLNS